MLQLYFHQFNLVYNHVCIHRNTTRDVTDSTLVAVCEAIFFKHLPKWRVDWNKYSPKRNRARHVWRVTFFLNSPTNTKYRILRAIGRYFFSLNTLASIYQKSGIPQKNLDKNDDFVYSIYLFCCRVFFWIRRLKSSMFLVLFFFK